MFERFQPGDPFIDANGCLAERVTIDGIGAVIHYDDVPESDITTVDGIRCTTPLRTVIDLAPQYERDDLEHAIRDCLERGLFTADEAFARVGKTDMLMRPGATLFARALRDVLETP